MAYESNPLYNWGSFSSKKKNRNNQGQLVTAQMDVRVEKMCVFFLQVRLQVLNENS